MPNPPDSGDAQAWEIYLAFLTGRTNGDKKLARSAYKAADAFETVRAGHEESLKGPPAKSLKRAASEELEVATDALERNRPANGLSRGYLLNLIARARGFVRARARDGAQDRFFSSLSNLIEPELRGTGGFR